MDIYEPSVAEGYQWINCCRSEDYERFSSFNGASLRDTWKPIRMRFVDSAGGKTLLVSDFPWLSSNALIVRASAVKSLEDIFLTHGEILPLVTSDGNELAVFNSNVVDALDHEKSVLWRYPDSNRIMRIVKPAFHKAHVSGLDIFRLPYRAMPTYVSQRFVDRVHDAGLVGLDFEKVWSSI